MYKWNMTEDNSTIIQYWNKDTAEIIAFEESYANQLVSCNMWTDVLIIVVKMNIQYERTFIAERETASVEALLHLLAQTWVYGH